MIKGNIYCIYDKVAKLITGSLMCAESDDIIMRTVKTANLGEIIEKNLEDFDLYKIGTVEVQVPKCTGLANAEFVCHLEALKDVGCKK